MREQKTKAKYNRNLNYKDDPTSKLWWSIHYEQIY